MDPAAPVALHILQQHRLSGFLSVVSERTAMLILGVQGLTYQSAAMWVHAELTHITGTTYVQLATGLRQAGVTSYTTPQPHGSEWTQLPQLPCTFCSNIGCQGFCL